MDPLWPETGWSTFKYLIILIVSTYYILCISWIIKCLIIIDARCKYLKKSNCVVRRHTYLLVTSLLTPWCRVLLEKLTDPQLVKKFPTFYGTRRFITAITNACHLSLFWARSIQSMPPPHPNSWRSVLWILSQVTLTYTRFLHSKYQSISLGPKHRYQGQF